MMISLDNGKGSPLWRCQRAQTCTSDLTRLGRPSGVSAHPISKCPSTTVSRKQANPLDIAILPRRPVQHPLGLRSVIGVYPRACYVCVTVYIHTKVKCAHNGMRTWSSECSTVLLRGFHAQNRRGPRYSVESTRALEKSMGHNAGLFSRRVPARRHNLSHNLAFAVSLTMSYDSFCISVCR